MKSRSEVCELVQAKVRLKHFALTPHVLRHAYATHSREPIESLRQLMGHISIETTAGYRHALLDRASNPLDDLLGASSSVVPKTDTRTDTKRVKIGTDQ